MGRIIGSRIKEGVRNKKTECKNEETGGGDVGRKSTVENICSTMKEKRKEVKENSWYRS